MLSYGDPKNPVPDLSLCPHFLSPPLYRTSKAYMNKSSQTTWTFLSKEVLDALICYVCHKYTHTCTHMYKQLCVSKLYHPKSSWQMVGLHHFDLQTKQGLAKLQLKITDDCSKLTVLFCTIYWEITFSKKVQKTAGDPKVILCILSVFIVSFISKYYRKR